MAHREKEETSFPFHSQNTANNDDDIDNNEKTEKRKALSTGCEKEHNPDTSHYERMFLA